MVDGRQPGLIVVGMGDSAGGSHAKNGKAIVRKYGMRPKQ